MNYIYVRISSKNQSKFNESYTSIENQKEVCEKYCNENNLLIDNIISEVCSAKNIKNQKKLIEIINNDNISNIIFYNISRFSRNSLDALNFLENSKKKNIILHFVQDNLITRNYIDYHRLRLTLSQSEFELNSISHRINSNNHFLKKKGWKFGIPPFGYESYFKNSIRQFRKNKLEINIIKFINYAREGKVSSQKLSDEIYKLNPDEKVPIEFIDENGNKIDFFDKKYTLNFTEISDLLNSYEIKCRGKEFNNIKIRNIYNKSNDINFNKLSI